MNKKHLFRKSGVLLHISSLPGSYGCGSFGKEACRFVDFLSENGFSYWQVLPFCMPDRYNSPYASYGAFSGNPNFIDLPTLYEWGLLTAEELRRAEQSTPYVAEFSRLSEERMPLLRKAASRFTDEGAIEAYLNENPHVREFCTYMALKEKNPSVPWQEWTEESYRTEDFFFHAFIQYVFDKQWQAVKSYANSRGISIIGDIPIYVALDSADVYFHRSLFQLRKDGRPRAVAGVPPDFFSEDGQLWGNPLYNWTEMQKDNFLWWRERMTHMLHWFDGVRIDHFRGLESYFTVAAEETTARNGKWRKGPGRPFIRVLQKTAGKKLMIAEDLGFVTAAVRDLVDYSDFLSMRIFEFGFTNPPEEAHKPHAYPPLSVAYTGTHDNTTLLAFLWEMTPEERRRVFSYCGYPGEDIHVGLRSALRALFASASSLVILPIQDVLAYGADTRMNTPGRAEGNWSYRVTEEQLSHADSAFFRELNAVYGRAPKAEEAL